MWHKENATKSATFFTTFQQYKRCGTFLSISFSGTILKLSNRLHNANFNRFQARRAIKIKITIEISGKKKASVKTNFKSIQILSEAVRECRLVLVFCFTEVYVFCG